MMNKDELKKELEFQIEQKNNFFALYNQSLGAIQLLEFLINKDSEGEKSPSKSEDNKDEILK